VAAVAETVAMVAMMEVVGDSPPPPLVRRRKRGRGRGLGLVGRRRRPARAARRGCARAAGRGEAGRACQRNGSGMCSGMEQMCFRCTESWHGARGGR
jgi:hypothetical protein